MYFDVLEYTLWSIYVHAADFHTSLICNKTSFLKLLTMTALSSIMASYLALFYDLSTVFDQTILLF